MHSRLFTERILICYGDEALAFEYVGCVMVLLENDGARAVAEDKVRSCRRYSGEKACNLVKSLFRTLEHIHPPLIYVFLPSPLVVR